jgi:hypothetical protein
MCKLISSLNHQNGLLHFHIDEPELFDSPVAIYPMKRDFYQQDALILKYIFLPSRNLFSKVLKRSNTRYAKEVQHSTKEL